MDGVNDVSKRYKTLPLDKIDAEALARKVITEWTDGNNAREDALTKREEYTQNWRDLNVQRRQGPWENSSDFQIPMTLIYGKAIHARLWQLFSDFSNLFGVKAKQQIFEEREGQIKEFMQFLLEHYVNSRQGTREVFDEWLWETVFDGSGYLKLYSQRDVHKYLDVVPIVEIEEELVFDSANLTGVTNTSAKMKEKDQVKTDVIETPQIKRISMEDILLPIGEGDPQTAEWVQHRIFMTDDALKSRALEGKFDREQVEKALGHKQSLLSGQVDEIKRVRNELDGYSDPNGYFRGYHAVLERYGKAYIKKDLSNESELDQDIDELPQEIVVWVHQASGLALGWTYLHRISPSGIRPIFKSDFIRFPDRAHGVGVAEVLAPTVNAMNAIYNLRQDNGVIASTPFGFYRASSGLKPDKIQYDPGTFLPLDDVNDVKMVQFPFLSNFGYQEEDRLNSYAERILNISDIQILGAPKNVGVYRTASGTAASQQESQIQIDIHFDRIARTLSRLFQALFRLARERMPEELVYRVTGEQGQPIFGKVNREDLRGEYDFDINVDILGESRTEAQQKATLLMQTLINPAFTNTGVVSPENLYHLAKNFLMKNRFKRIDNFIASPPQYEGEPMTPSQRIFAIVAGNFQNPPIESTVRLNEDHQKALAEYEGFKKSDTFGLMTQQVQLEALDRLIQRHNQLMAAQQAGGNPNLAGMQTPREGFAPIEAGGQDLGTLGAPQGEANGPI